MIEIYGASETAGIGFRRDAADAFALLPRWQRGIDEDTLIELETGNQYPLSDHLKWTGATHFQPLGRRDGAIQVGGINVFPGSIAERLQQLPNIAAAAVRLMSPAEGTRLKAFIVPSDNSITPDELAAFLHTWCAKHLSAAERPKAFSFGPALPRNATGKLCDWVIGQGTEPSSETR